MPRIPRIKTIYFLIISVSIVFCVVPTARAQEITKKPFQPRCITLAQGVSIILNDSRLIRAAFYDVQMADDQAYAEKAELLPRIDMFAQASFLRYQPAAKFGGQNINTGNRNFLTAGLSVYQTLFDFGKTISIYKAANEILDARQANLEIVRRVAVLEFVLAYFDFLEVQKMVTVAKKELNSLTSYCGDIERLYRQGVVVKNDLLPVQVKRAAAKQRLIGSRNDLISMKFKLNALLNRSLSCDIILEDTKIEAPRLSDYQQVQDETRKLRPEIVFIDAQIRASKLEQKARIANDYPLIFTNAEYDYAQNRYQTRQSNGLLALGMKFNIFDGNNSKALTNKERNHQKQLFQQREKLVQDIQFEIENASLDARDALEKVKVARQVLIQSQENVRVTREKYAEGAATTTEILEAVTLRTQAQTNYYNAEYSLNRAYARLIYSIGGDLAAIIMKAENREERGKNENA